MNFWEAFTKIVATIGVGILFFTVVKSITAAGEVTHCYVEYHRPSQNSCDIPYYSIKGNIPWRQDINLGRAANEQEIAEIMATISECQRD